eukprot:g13247.t1
MQTRQDIRADVEQEKALRQKLLADMQILAESEQIRTSPVVDDVDEETPFSFAPVSQKRDLVRFYYQNGARAPNMSGIFVAVPQRVLDEQQGQNPQHPSWWSSDSKRELQDFVRQKALTVLGMAYTVIRMVKIQVTANPAKVAQLIRLGEELTKCIDNKNVKEKALLTYKGLFRHVSQLDRLKASQAKALDFWVGENFSKSIKKHNGRRQLRLSIETMNYAAKRVKPRLLTVEAASRPIAHLYTDAAGEDFAELNRRLATGERTGFEGHAMFVGGFLALPSGEKKAFKMHVVDVPEGVDKLHIGVLEARCLQSHYPNNREDFPHLLNCLHLTDTAVEIGVQRGVHAKQFLNKWKGKQLLLVDKWTHVVSDTYIDIANIPSESMVALKEIAVNNLKTTVPRYRILQEWSEDAARKHVENESLDFVYLDARHDFNGVFADLVAWWPKLKIGGIIAGHDYCDGELPEGDFFVQTAVASFLEGGNGDGVDGGGTGTAPEDSPQTAVHTTREAARFTSFFVLKTKELDARVKSNSFRSFPIDHVYSRHSWYFSLFYRDPDNFKKKCQTLCQFDCDRRLRQLFPEDFALSVERPVCGDARTVKTANVGSPSTSTGRSGAGGSGEPHPAHKDVIVTDVTTRPPTTSAAMEVTEGSTPSGASSSCIASESMLAQLQRESPTHGEFSSYQTECKRRCKVTCGQRQKLFADIRNKETSAGAPTVFRVDPEANGQSNIREEYNE